MRCNPFILLLSLVLVLGTATAGAEIPPQRQAELIYLLRHDCGSCHGMRLEGGLGPALNPRRLAGWSTEQLAATILHGRPGTPMPPWRPFFTDREALWLAARLKQGVRP